MYVLLLGLLLTALKYLQVDPVAQWAWWWVLSPFAVTAAWWAWSDASGRTKRKAMEKMDRRKAERLQKQKEALGMGPRRRR